MIKNDHRCRYEVLKNTVKSISILTGCTLLGFLFYRSGFTEANIIMVYILGVLLTSIAASHQIYSLISSVASVFIFNFLFTHPRFSFTAYETGYPVTFIVMFLTAYITGTFALRYKEQAKRSSQVAYRTRILFETNHLLSKAEDKSEIINAAAQQMTKLLNRNIVVFENTDGFLSGPKLFHADSANSLIYDRKKELVAAEWVLKNNHSAGATTQILYDLSYLYLPMSVNDRIYGVVGIESEGCTLDALEYDISLSIMGECALALENEKNVREKKAAAILAESEQLRANLLRTISHDLRTPLTTILGNASNLMSNGNSFDEETKKQVYSDIYDDSVWLLSLVENLLYATRIEEGRMTLHTSTELFSDIVEEAVKHVSRKAENHSLTVVHKDDLMFVKADAKLVVQVIINLIDNAIKYTPSGSSIVVSAVQNGNMAEIKVSDTGPGIPDQEKKKIFDKFYCGTNKIVDNRRSLGLGLYLCKSIVEAHGGTICVMDHMPHGAVFLFTIPIKEVDLHE